MPISAVNIKLDTKKLDELIVTMPKKAKALVASSALQVEAWAKERAPRDPQRPPKDPSQPITGNLKNSIKAEEESPFLWRVNVGMEYGIYQEFGTGRAGGASNRTMFEGLAYSFRRGGIPARPFLYPAVERLAKDWRKRWEELVKNV